MAQHQPTHLRDYTPSAFAVDRVVLTFDLDPSKTEVRSQLWMRRVANTPADQPLVLDGSASLTLTSIALDDAPLMRDAYSVDQDHLTIHQVPDTFVLSLAVDINPLANKALTGLYMSGGTYCSQCEPHGFRHITYFLDRPDVLTRFKVTVTGDASTTPVLLSNGDCVATGSLPGHRHWATWDDPSLKPCYLFALVAGTFDVTRDSFVTAEGRTVETAIYAPPGRVHQATFALKALHRAMRWDEEVYGRCYDLNTFNIVAVDDFNMGAMENKGLNVFNSKCLLADPASATDQDFAWVDGVVAHEYFHNWTGNRVTCRDWFQLSLKEGLTVFRDQCYTADQFASSLKRVQDARVMMLSQFPEDAGPTAHPIRPWSYVEMNNFYTVTVYQKGAEVIRMMHTLLGPERFRRGMDVYFQRHDGQAVTTDDFISAMQDATGEDLTHFRRWYIQAGTPHVRVHVTHDEGRVTLTCSQSTPPTPDQPFKRPQHLPLRFAWLDAEDGAVVRGAQVETQGEHVVEQADGSWVWSLTKERATLTMVGLDRSVVLSMLRGFSAPVQLDIDRSDDVLTFLVGHDGDGFSRWSAFQSLLHRTIEAGLAAWVADQPIALPPSWATLVEPMLAQWSVNDPGWLALCWTFPTVEQALDRFPGASVEGLHNVLTTMQRVWVEVAGGPLWQALQRISTQQPYVYGADDMAQRSLRSTLMLLLTHATSDTLQDALGTYAHQLLDNADNMTDTMAALQTLVRLGDGSGWEAALERFRTQGAGDPLWVDKWLALHAGARYPSTEVAMEQLNALAEHPDMLWDTPNRVRAFLGTFCRAQPMCFHQRDGAGYRWLLDHVQRLDRSNPQLAARLLAPCLTWRRLDPERQQVMLEALRTLASATLSPDCRERVDQALRDAPTL